VKRTVTYVAGVLALGAALYAGSRLLAQNTGAARPAAAPQTRIAVINLPYIYKNYEKYKNFLKQMQDEEKNYANDLKTKQDQKEAKAKALSGAVDAAQKEKLETEIRNLQREVEDLAAKARKELNKKAADMLVQVYREIRDAAFRHAQGHNFDLVLHFSDGTTEQEMNSAQAILPKMQAGGCVPLYWNPALDISGHVLYALNTAYNGTSKSAAPAGTPAAPGSH
jgi:Skp family chaperone for outer membrane proteins